MKKILTLSLLALGAISTNAQTGNSFSHPNTKHEDAAGKKFRTHVMRMLANQQNGAKQKTTGLTERVIAESSYELYSSTTPSIYDTTQYKYSGTNGSKFNFNSMDFNSSFFLDLSPYSYPYDWSILPVMADTVRYWSKDSATGPMLITELTTAGFNSNKNLTFYKDFYYDMGMADGADFNYHTYNAQGKIAEMAGLSDYGSGIDSSLKIVFYYNTQGTLTHDSVFSYTNNQWVPSAVVNYTYDAAGNITTISVDAQVSATTWSTTEKYDNTFYANNKLKTSIGYYYGATTLEPDLKDSFGYTNNSAYTTHQSQYMWSNGTWKPEYQMIKHLNAQGLPDTVYQNGQDHINNAWVPYIRTHYTYTGYGNPQMASGYSFDGQSWWLANVLNYYYEIYNDPTGVKDIVAQEEMNVYPNPVASEINISWKKGAGNKVSIEMINATGQRVYQAFLTWKQENEAMALQGLTPGMYWLIVKNEAGAVIFKQAVVKQ